MTIDLTAWTSSTERQLRARGLAERGMIKSTSPEHPGGGHVLDVDTEHVIAQFIVWPSGATEASVVSIASGQRLFFRDAAITTMDELDAEFGDFLRAVVQLDSELPA